MRLTVIDIGGTAIKSALYEDGKLRDVKESETQASKGGPYVAERAVEIIRGYGQTDGIGVSTAGQVDFQKGTIRHANSNIPNYTGMDMRGILETEFQVPAIIENDVNAAAIGEGCYGAARGISDYLCLTYGTGVGGAVVIGGKVYRGHIGSAGEFGSIIIHGDCVTDGERISGCYEERASTTALVRRVQRIKPEISNGREVFAALEQPEVKREIDAWTDEVAHGLVTLVHIFNPGCVILGGGVMSQQYVLETVREKVLRRVMPSFRDVELNSAQLGNTAGLWGAVHLAENYVREKS